MTRDPSQDHTSPCATSHTPNMLHTNRSFDSVPSPPFSVSQPTNPPSPKPIPQPSQRSRRGRKKSSPLSIVCPWSKCKSKRVFTRQCDFDKHFREHTKPVKCPFQVAQLGCGVEGFSQNKGLYRHLWVSHREYAQINDIPKVDAKCPVCHRTERADNLKRHMKTHEQGA
ncbi:hypothetical protein B0T16DRAFT_418053 [Cercophora newfieldiana]|uniref:C2H2-type domain-containing protein n=1 Tax=Cercophora newfieldiana TaxID=92897 RepID=A0AA40CMQ7_9PEZI|nr:hypothetical protein B0T16DRAFT_418053 [Cercophora newfieldiana]